MKHNQAEHQMRHELISGWGGRPVRAHQVRSSDLERATRGAVLSRGLGRSYGDASLPPSDRREVVTTTLADRLLAFDPETGSLRAEAGVTLRQLFDVFLPQGWFSPVSPGTWNVTLGGMVAADVHGKNHHVAGCFGAHVRRLLLRVADGRLIECSRDSEPELFCATLGGMGLTGHILEVEFELERIPSPWIVAEKIRLGDIDELIGGLEMSARSWPFTVAWLDALARGDALGRGVLIRGRWAEPDEAPWRIPRRYRRPSVPFNLPDSVLRGPLVRLFNSTFYRLHRTSAAPQIVHPQAFFYPLDAIGHWHRLYGRRGVTQYQCVLPRSAGPRAAREVLETLLAHGGASFLCVAKDCGAEGTGMLSFPMPGVSLALDLPIRDDTPALIAALNERVIERGGRIYLAKDAYTRPEQLSKMDRRLPRWRAVRDAWDPKHAIRSAQSERLLGDRP
jgi:FAD/FMN-containing dehydrogenase